MRKHYDFSNARPNPYAKLFKKSITIRVDVFALQYFQQLAMALDIPYQTLINSYLRECALKKRELRMQWLPPRRTKSKKR